MRLSSDRSLAWAMLALQAATLLGVLWVGASMDRQRQLTQTLIAMERPMTTTIHWSSGNTTDVFTPRREGEDIATLSARHNSEVAYVKQNPPPGESLP